MQKLQRYINLIPGYVHINNLIVWGLHDGLYFNCDPEEGRRKVLVIYYGFKS